VPGSLVGEVFSMTAEHERSTVTETAHYGLIILLTSAVGLVSVLSNRLTSRVKIPVPLLVLVGAALAVNVAPDLHAPPERTVERVVTVALVVILFEGGMHIGWSRLREAVAPTLVVGVLGTFLTTAAAALLLHLAFGFEWYVSVLVATAVAPTDPAVVFSVLGQREVAGRAGTILEGESGANDPVGIALMVSLIMAGSLNATAFGGVGLEFLLQMAVGAVFGVVGGVVLIWFTRRMPLPSEALYPLRTLACGLMLYGVTALAHGSGFLAVFVAGIVIGDARAPYKREVERFHSALASLSEIVAFVVLGSTIDLHTLARSDVLVPGLILGVVLAFVIRPVVVGACLAPARLRRSERAFVVFAGLKGAVPILLGELLRVADVPEAERLYGIVVVVVIFSVLVQGSLVPTVAAHLRLPMRRVQPEPWALGMRLRHEPGGVHYLTVTQGSTSEGRTIEEVADRAGDVWVSLVVRESRLVPVRGDTVLAAGDHVMVLADPDLESILRTTFGEPDLTADAG